MIAHILLLPHESTRSALLAPGAPVWIAEELDEPAEFGWTVDPDTRPNDDTDDPDESDTRPRTLVAWPSVGVTGAVSSSLHLVLARDGAVVPEGVDRLCRVEWAAGIPAWTPGQLESALKAILSEPTVVAQGAFPLGTLVLLDAEGREVAS